MARAVDMGAVQIGDVFAVVLGFFKARFWPSAWWMLVGARPLRGMGHNILLDRTAFQMTMTDIQRDLFAMQDEAYRDFHSKLVPALDKQRIIGVRTPILRRYARQLASRDDCAAFLADPPHRYYEENNIHAWIIASSSRDIDTVLPLVDGFLPRIDNWATCDLFAPKIFSKHRHRVIEYIPRWLVVPHLYGAFRHSHAAAILSRRGFRSAAPRLGGRHRPRRLLHPYRRGMVFQHRAGQTMGCDAAPTSASGGSRSGHTAKRYRRPSRATASTPNAKRCSKPEIV